MAVIPTETKSYFHKSNDSGSAIIDLTWKWEGRLCMETQMQENNIFFHIIIFFFLPSWLVQQHVIKEGPSCIVFDSAILALTAGVTQYLNMRLLNCYAGAVFMLNMKEVRPVCIIF